MHNHNSKMMWFMMAGCILLPVLFLLFFGRGQSSFDWLWLGFLAVCVGGHAFMMRGHKHNDRDKLDNQKADADESEYKH